MLKVFVKDNAVDYRYMVTVHRAFFEDTRDFWGKSR